MPSKCRFGAQRHAQGTPSSGTTLVRVTQGRRIYNALLNTRRVGAASDPRGVDRRSRARGEPERAPGDCRRSHAANARHRRMRPRCSGVFARAIAMTFAAGESRASASVTWSRDRRKFAESHTHDSFVEVDADSDQLRADAPGQRSAGSFWTPGAAGATRQTWERIS
jgi:hypothetical protein